MGKYYEESLKYYLNLRASKEGISIEDLKKRIIDSDIVMACEISSFFESPKMKAKRKFVENAKEYDAVVGIKRNSSRDFWGGSRCYEIHGMGIKIK